MGVPVTDELYDLVLFVVHSFVRPIATELYALKHHDITVADDPKRLIVTVRNGKTGFRSSNTMPSAVSVYERIRKRYLNAKGEDYIFLPQYLNCGEDRSTSVSHSPISGRVTVPTIKAGPPDSFRCQKALTSLLVLLICGSVAAEPIHKQTTTAASRRGAAKTQNANTTSKEPTADEAPV